MIGGQRQRGGPTRRRDGGKLSAEEFDAQLPGRARPDVAPRTAEDRLVARGGGDRAADRRHARASPRRSFNAYPFTLGVASGDPLPDGVVLWTRLAPEPLEAAACRWRRRGAVGDRQRPPVPNDRAEGDRGRAAGARAQRPRRGRGAGAGREYWYRFRAGGRGQPDRPDEDGAGGGRRRRSAAVRASAAAATTRPAISRRTGASPRSSSISSSTPATTSTRAARTAAGTDGRVRQHNGDEIYTLVDYRNRYAHVQVGSRSDGRARARRRSS